MILFVLHTLHLELAEYFRMKYTNSWFTEPWPCVGPLTDPASIKSIFWGKSELYLQMVCHMRHAS